VPDNTPKTPRITVAMFHARKNLPDSKELLITGDLFDAEIEQDEPSNKIKQAVRDTVILFIPMLTVLLIVILFPQLILWLPRLLMGYKG
jgi:hypothetical protein